MWAIGDDAQLQQFALAQLRRSIAQALPFDCEVMNAHDDLSGHGVLPAQQVVKVTRQAIEEVSSPAFAALQTRYGIVSDVVAMT